MFTESVQKRIGWLTGASVFLVTVVVTPASTMDPINVPKLWVLLAAVCAMGGVMLTQFKTLFGEKNWFVIIPARALLVVMLIALFVTTPPFSQQLFGTYGRNTGLLNYFALGTLFIAAAVATGKSAVKPFLFGTSAALLVNIVYGLIQAIGNDPIKWANPYAPVIGTFGNPNFVSAFMGMGVAFALSYLVAKGSDIKIRVLSALYFVIALFDIAKSDAQQGIIVSLLSVGLVGYFLLKAKFPNPVIRFSYLGLGVIAGLIGVFGTLQKGPLASILYKPSVTYRGDYWHAGIEMFKNHPWFGVGLDSFGDYYRVSRTVEATLRRGPSTVSNAAHNVFIDIAATAGIFALLAYLAVIAVGMRAAWKISKRSNNFDPFFVSIFVAWVGYLVQSVISINNIALGIWGWVLPGMLVAIDRWQREEKIVYKKSNATDFTGMAMIAGLAVGGVVGFLPFNSDATFRNAIESGDANKVYAAATKWPTDVARLMYAAQVFDQNKMQDKAVSLAREAVKLNPRSFDAWNYLYNSPSVTGNEKREILDRLKALDPNNPDLKKLG